jgi:hypothetical protein
VDVWPVNVKTSSFTFYAVLTTYDISTIVPTPTTSPAQNFVDVFSNQTIGGNKIWSGLASFPGGMTGAIPHAGVETFNGAVSFPGGITGNPAFSGTPSFAAGASLAGTFSGSPTFSGAPTFSGNPVFSLNPVFSGSPSFTGKVTISNAGVFTNVQTSEYLQSLIGGCSTSEYGLVQAGNFTTDAIAGCATMPVTATVHQVDGIAGYVVNNANVSQSGGAVGGYFQARNTGNNASSFGTNSLVQDTAGNTGHQMIASEFDTNVLGAPARVWGILLNGASNGTMPALGSSAGIEIRAPGAALANSLRWPAALNIIDSTGTVAINVGTVASGNSQSSQPIQLQGRDSGGVTRNLQLSGSPGGALTINALTVATLPSAAANPGGIAYVTDSTAVASEGQTCAGSSSTKALAFSNGTVWKCF